MLAVFLFQFSSKEEAHGFELGKKTHQDFFTILMGLPWVAVTTAFLTFCRYLISSIDRLGRVNRKVTGEKAYQYSYRQGCLESQGLCS